MQTSVLVADPSFALPPSIDPEPAAPPTRVDRPDEPPLRPEALPTTPGSTASTFTALLIAQAEAPFSMRREGLRVATGLGLAAVFGLAIGARTGGTSFLVHALFVPLVLALALGLGLPALYIVLALFDAPLHVADVLASAARTVAVTGLVLAGVAPSVLLFVVTSDRPGGAAVAAGAGLLLAGAVGLRQLYQGLAAAMIGASPSALVRWVAGIAFAGFGVFAVVLSSRAAGALLPVFGGAR